MVTELVRRLKLGNRLQMEGGYEGQRQAILSLSPEPIIIVR